MLCSTIGNIWRRGVLTVQLLVLDSIEWRSVATVMIFISLIQRIENIEERVGHTNWDYKKSFTMVLISILSGSHSPPMSIYGKNIFMIGFCCRLWCLLRLEITIHVKIQNVMETRSQMVKRRTWSYGHFFYCHTIEVVMQRGHNPLVLKWTWIKIII